MGTAATSGADPFARLQSLYERAIQRKDWQQAAQTRANAASMAQLRGRTDDAQRYFRDAIELAKQQGLRRIELDQRIQRYRLLLTSDLTGQVRDELNAELTWGLLPTGGAELKGAIVDQLDRYGSSALAAYETLLQRGSEPVEALRDLLKVANEQALAFSLIYLAGQFEDSDLTNDRIQVAATSARVETIRICNAMRVELFLIGANFEHVRGGLDTRDDLLDSAERLAQSLPGELVNVYMAKADYASGDSAINYARKAVEASEQVSFAGVKGQAAAKLNALLARTNQEQVAETSRPGTGATDLVMEVINGAVEQAMLDGRFQEALSHLNSALQHASSPKLRRLVLDMRAIAFYELGRRGEAETDVDECISLLAAELTADRAFSTGGFDNRIPEEENLYLIKGFLRARAGRNAESWSAAEQGRSGRLKREIPGAPEFSASFESIRQWLHARRAAMISFGPTRWGTLALTAGPDDSEPQCRILDFASPNLLKNTTLDENILESIPGLSAGLIHPLLSRLTEITRQARVLYIVPDSALYCAPFAALTLDDTPGSRMLIDLCPLAIAPSAAVLLWCASRTSSAAERDCLSVAAGSSQGIDFRDDLPAVASAPWEKPPTELVDEAAIAASVSGAAPQHSVLYLSCHGTVAQDRYELMAASQLELAGGSHISARDVLGWKIHADLVFLNACLAGRFRTEARTDVTGFVKAFMLAGARSLIAPLIRVEPVMARDLAASFFETWLTGVSKAEALRTAQLTARDKYPDKGWATFWLFWDFL